MKKERNAGCESCIYYVGDHKKYPCFDYFINSDSIRCKKAAYNGCSGWLIESYDHKSGEVTQYTTACGISNENGHCKLYRLKPEDIFEPGPIEVSKWLRFKFKFCKWLRE